MNLETMTLPLQTESNTIATMLCNANQPKSRCTRYSINLSSPHTSTGLQYRPGERLVSPKT
jgi:hypothetical protein